VAGRDGGLSGRERAGERGVGVAVHEHELGVQVGQNRLQPREDAPGLGGVAPTAGVQLVGRRRHAELVEEDPRQLVVVVLAGVDDDLVGALAQPA
jgi:hypothetical protein